MENTNENCDSGCVDDDPSSGGGGGFPMNKDDRPILVTGSSEEEEDNQVSEVHYEFMLKFPTEIIFDILSRLPMGDLSKCRRLSKGWYHLINTPSFLTMRHNKLIKNHSPCVFLHLRPKSEPLCYSMIGDRSLGSNVTLLMPQFPIHLNRIRNIYSSNGLILVEAHSESTTNFIKLGSCFYVCNPITRKHNQIPKPYWADAQTRFIFDIRFSGDPDVPEPYWPHSQTHFIFDPAAEVFKIVRINFNVIQVYSSRVGEWRTIEKTTFRAPPTDVLQVLQEVFVNGALHWLGSSLEAPPSITDTIISLRFDTEEFKLIPLPDGLDLSILKKDCCYLVVLGDCLSLATEVGNEHVEIWVMKEYGLQSSWDKKYIIQDTWIYRAITLMPNGEILAVSSSGNFGFYNHETKVFRSTNVCVDIFKSVYFTVISLISPVQDQL